MHQENVTNSNYPSWEEFERKGFDFGKQRAKEDYQSRLLAFVLIAFVSGYFTGSLMGNSFWMFVSVVIAYFTLKRIEVLLGKEE